MADDKASKDKAGGKKTTDKKVAPKKEAPKKEAPKKAAPKKEAPKKAAPKKETPKKTAPKKEAPKKQAPKKEAPKKAAPKKEAPKKQAPKKTASKEGKAAKKAKKRPAYDGPTSDHKVNVYSLKGKKKGKINLPVAFDNEVRRDLIRNAVTRARANRRQPYGPAPRSGFRHSVEQWGKGRGVARVQRVKGERRGAQSPGTVGGRRAHPPTPEKKWSKKMNTKERHMARMSALSATRDPEMVTARGHQFDEGLTLPVVMEEAFERMSKDADEGFYKAMEEVLDNVGLLDDVIRAEAGRHQRAGRGKTRGRRFRTPTSVLVVVDDIEGMRPFFRNMPGVEVVTPEQLSTERLAPGGDPGRLTMISIQALELMMGW
jgi:large subunit ribosomal protein L4e